MTHTSQVMANPDMLDQSKAIKSGETSKGNSSVKDGSGDISHNANKGGLCSAADSLRAKVNLPANMEWTFYVGGGNGVSLIEDTLNDLGYKRIKEKHDDSYRFRWCELKGNINYNTFKEGEQMVNHIPNCNLLTNKLGLLNSLREYDKACVTFKKRASKLDFIPETYKLDEKGEREQFFSTFTEGDVWICKPTAKNQGKGIFLVRNLDEVSQVIRENEELNNNLKAHGRPLKPLNRIIQRYIPNPLLLEGKKFDIRAYMLIANMCPYLVLYHKGYVRLCLHEYNHDGSNLTAHLTNQFIQKKDPMYKDTKEDTVWSMDKFNDYLNKTISAEKGIEENWVYNILTNRMKQIMTFCFNSVKHKLKCKIGYSDLYGLDFMIDDNMKVWLIEVNVNPSLATNCEALKSVIPDMVRETIYLSIECFEKSRRSRPLMPLQSLQNFTILYNGSSEGVNGATRKTHRSTTASPSKTSIQPDKAEESVKRSRSLSPLKESTESPARSRNHHRNVLEATPTMVTGHNLHSSRDVIANHPLGQPLKALRERTVGAYRSLRPINKDLKGTQKSLVAAQRTALGKTASRGKPSGNFKSISEEPENPQRESVADRVEGTEIAKHAKGKINNISCSSSSHVPNGPKQKSNRSGMRKEYAPRGS